MITDPIFKKIYTSTLETFPAAFLLAAAAFYVVSSSLWVALWLGRGEMKECEEERGRRRKGEGKGDDDDDDSSSNNNNSRDNNNKKLEGHVNPAVVVAEDE